MHLRYNMNMYECKHYLSIRALQINSHVNVYVFRLPSACCPQPPARQWVPVGIGLPRSMARVRTLSFSRAGLFNFSRAISLLILGYAVKSRKQHCDQSLEKLQRECYLVLSGYFWMVIILYLSVTFPKLAWNVIYLIMYSCCGSD